MTKHKKSSGKSSSRSSNAMPAGISPQSLRKLEKALANLGHAPDAASPFDDGPGETPLDRAQDLIYQAWEIPNPAKRISLAKRALDICPDCADAHMLLAEEQAHDLEESIERLQQAVDAGRRAIGDDFESDVGYFWGLLETRPYMRARWALALAQWEFGERSLAIGHAQDMLRLNPNDNQGVRSMLMTWLLMNQRVPEARKLWKQYEDTASADWAWSRALMDFIEHGDGDEANTTLAKALAANPYLAPLLLGREALPAHPPEFIGMGDRDEAIAYVFHNLELWQQIDGALRWLSGAVPSH
jgi:tetratricopeptide (TPR) repeat protein